jgi:hypothetical protein
MKVIPFVAVWGFAVYQFEVHTLRGLEFIGSIWQG